MVGGGCPLLAPRLFPFLGPPALCASYLWSFSSTLRVRVSFTPFYCVRLVLSCHCISALFATNDLPCSCSPERPLTLHLVRQGTLSTPNANAAHCRRSMITLHSQRSVIRFQPRPRTSPSRSMASQRSLLEAAILLRVALPLKLILRSSSIPDA